MIKFFRRIRQKSLSESKFSKYLFYAIGEIFLVVIGILIALQLDNLNDIRKNNSKEQLVLKSLQTDFAKNLKVIQQELKSTEEAYYASIELKALISPNGLGYSINQVDSLISEMFDYIAFDPISGAIDEVINSGQLNIIQNNNIKDEISQWSRIINDAETDIEIANNYAFDKLIPYLTRNASISNMLIDQTIMDRAKLRPLPPSNFDINYRRAMSSLEFENMVNWHAINLIYLVDEYKDFVQPYLENILTLLDDEITND